MNQPVEPHGFLVQKMPLELKRMTFFQAPLRHAVAAMGKTKKLAKKSAGAVSDAKAGVRRSIGKAQKSSKAVPKTLKAADTSITKAVTAGPQSRRALVTAVSAARAEGKVVRSLTGPRPKMTGASMMEEIEEARAHAEKVAESAQRKKRRRGKKLSQHSKEVLAAFNASPVMPFLPQRG
eukprot:s4014_g1.t2